MKTNILIIGFAFLVSLYSCKQNVILPTGNLVSLNIVDATIGSAPLAVKFNQQKIVFSSFTSNEISYGSSHIYTPITGANMISIIQATDTSNYLFQGNFNLQQSNIYSLFLTGTKTQPDTVFVHEQLPVYPITDSVAGVRFVNLSPGSNPISINIKGQPVGSEVSQLGYKKFTSFKPYQADHTISSYVFEVRDASSGILLVTYTLSGINNSTGTNTTKNTVRFHNQTIALIGQPSGGTVAQSAVLVPNY